MKRFNWNPVYNLVMEIKQEYKNKNGKISDCNFENWVKKLNAKKYNDFIEPLYIIQDKNLLLLKYNLIKVPKSFWEDENSIYRECRSLVVDLKEEKIVVAPWKKFFNIGETSENELDKIKEKIERSQKVEITNKLDGSMCSVRYYNNKIKLFTSKALTPKISWRIKDSHKKLNENYKKMIRKNPKYTFMFENISPENRHVVSYSKKEAGLYLTGMRNIYTGKQLSYKKIKSFSKKYNVPMVEFENKTLNEILNLSKKMKGTKKEGWVINIDGHLVKLKCNDYIELHKVIVNQKISIKVIIKHIAENTFDDFISKIPKEKKGEIWEIHSRITDYLNKTYEKIYKYIKEINDKLNVKNRKEVMVWISKNVPKTIQHYVRYEYLGKEYNLLKEKYGNAVKYKKASEIGIANPNES